MKRYIEKHDNQNIKIQEKNFYTRILKYSIWFIFSPVVANLFRYTDRWMLNKFLGLKDVGIYSVGLNITQVVFMFGMITGNILMPNLSVFWERGERERVNFFLNLGIKLNLFFLLILAGIIFFFKESIISLFYGEIYSKSVQVVNILLIFSLLTSILWTIRGYAGLIEKTYIPLICNLLGVISNIFLNYILIPHYGIIGAAIATTVSFGFIVIITFFWFVLEGFKIKLNTVLACLLPFVFLLHDLITILFFLFLLSFFIIDREEKFFLLQKIKIFKEKDKNAKS